MVAIVILVTFFAQHQQTTPKFKTRIAVPGFQSSALVLLADLEGFFHAESIDATLIYRATGRDCLDLVIAGQAEYAVAFETPIVHAVRAQHDVVILTEVHRSEENSAVVARKDRGINRRSDLRGKTVAVVSRTNAEFLLDLILRSRLVDTKTVKIKPMSIDKAVTEVVSGAVDAAALWEPYLSQATSKDPASFSILRSSYYSEFSNLVSLRRTIDSQSELSYAVLRALGRANEFYEKKGAKARSDVDRLLTERGFFVSQATWDRTDIHLGLSATLLTMFNEETAWFNNREGIMDRFDMRPSFSSRFVKAVVPKQVTYE